MSSAGYRAWVAAGKPDSGLALPLAQLRDVLRSHGLTVFDEPDDHHLLADPPQDHTQFSATGWPHESPRWWRHAIDIMPPPSGGAMLRIIGEAIFDARQAGLITWLKYMNWPNEGNLNHAVEDRWEPDHVRAGSGDTGHIHLSCVTGVETLPDPFDPYPGVVVVAPGLLATDGRLGPLTIRAWQRTMHTTDDGVITQPPGRSELVAAVQRRLNTFGAGLDVDGQGIEQGGPASHTTRALQAYLGTQQDGVISAPVSAVVAAVQHRLNLGWF
jgi:hypothetical protein